MNTRKNETAFSLRQAAARVGLERHALKAWLRDAGYKFPRVRRGSKLRISRRALTHALQSHEVARSEWGRQCMS